jgi:hypothetical protein
VILPNSIEEPTVEAEGAEPDALTAAVNALINRTPEQKLADRAAVMKTARLGRPLPEGKTFFEVVQGTWPGDETDEQIFEALERLS